MADKYHHWYKERLYILIFALLIALVFIFSKELATIFDRFLDKSILEYITGMIFLLVLVSIILQYKIKDEIHSNEYTKRERNYKERHQHNHLSYSHISVFIATVVGLLFTAYSDVFYQQGDPISPIITGLKSNESTFQLDNLKACNDTTNLVFVLDVSGSINSTKTIADTLWIKNSENTIVDYYGWELPSKKQDFINKINPKIPFDLVKLKICALLISQRDSLINDNRNYNVSLFSFGKNPDVLEKGFNLKDKTAFEKMIITILSIVSSADQASKTDNEKVIKKISNFVNLEGNKDAFNRPRTVISIFSDFINDSKSQDTNKLNTVISEIANKSTFFNLFYLESKDSLNFINDIKILPIFNKTLYPEQINLQKLTNEIDLRCANFKSPYCIEFIIDKPFHIDSSKTCLKILNDKSLVNIKLNRLDKDDWQQFRINNNPINYESSVNVKNNDYLIFSGHAPDQFSKTLAEFEFPNSREKITCEIIFKKGLPNFIARVFFSSGVMVLFISILYFFYLIVPKQLIDWFKKLFKRKKSEVAVSQGIHLKKNEIEGGFTVPCRFDNLDFEASIADKNTIPLAIAKHLLANEKLNDLSDIIEVPFGEDTIPLGSTKKFHVTLFTSTKDDVDFEVVEKGLLFCISKELLISLGYDENISDGVLKIRN